MKKDLTKTEVDLLAALMTRREVSRSELLQEVWGFSEDYDTSQTRTLDVTVSRLRKKIKDMKIISRYGKGYSLETIT